MNAMLEEPAEALREAFNELLQIAIENAEKEYGRKAARIGVVITGRGISKNIKINRINL